MKLISDEYKAQLQELHATDTTWGTTARKWGHHVQGWINGNGFKSVVDYGCGKGNLAQALSGVEMQEYDPGIPGKEALPGPADLVVALDVLEHIEPEHLDDVLAHMGTLAQRGLYFNVALYPAGTWLPDGRNAHLIVEPIQWWKERLSAAFPGWELEFVVASRPTRKREPKDCLIVRGLKHPV